MPSARAGARICFASGQMGWGGRLPKGTADGVLEDDGPIACKRTAPGIAVGPVAPPQDAQLSTRRGWPTTALLRSVYAQRSDLVSLVLDMRRAAPALERRGTRLGSECLSAHPSRHGSPPAPATVALRRQRRCLRPHRRQHRPPRLKFTSVWGHLRSIKGPSRGRRIERASFDSRHLATGSQGSEFDEDPLLWLRCWLRWRFSGSRAELSHICSHAPEPVHRVLVRI